MFDWYRMTMESLNDGPTSAHSIRIPDPLWNRLTAWAKQSGVGDAEALRTLLRLGLETPATPAVRPPAKWMLIPEMPHHCLGGRRRSSGCLGAPCGAAWQFDRKGWLLAQVPAGADRWDLSAVLAKAPGAVAAKGKRERPIDYVAIPTASLPSVQAMFEGRADRVRIHRLTTESD